eukprot:3733043-Alexandrium_andersonii.AAC.2
MVPLEEVVPPLCCATPLAAITSDMELAIASPLVILPPSMCSLVACPKTLRTRVWPCRRSTIRAMWHHKSPSRASPQIGLGLPRMSLPSRCTTAALSNTTVTGERANKAHSTA